MAEPETVDAFLARIADDPTVKDRVRESVVTARLLFEALGVRRIDDALLFVIGQHAGASDAAIALRREVARLQACLDRQRFN